MARITITDLLEAGVHFGHQTKRRNPKMKPYIYGARNGITIFDLTVTMRQLAEACQFLRDTVADGGEILFVGSKRQAQETVHEAAENTQMHYMCNRWLGGTLTNRKVVMGRVQHMKKLQKMETDGDFDQLPKKEVSSMRREMEKLQRTLGGIANLRKLPDAMVVVDVDREHIAVREAGKLDIPVVALVDSNCDPDQVDYVVPGNDDALRAIKIVVDAFAAAIAEGLALQGKETAAAPQPSAPAAKPEAAASAEPEAESAQEASGADQAEAPAEAETSEG